MKILFLNLANEHSSKYEHPTHTLAPLDIGYCASLLEKKGYYVEFIDTQLGVYNSDSLISYIKDKKPDVLVIKPALSQEEKVIRLSKEVRKFIRHIILIGPVSTLLYQKLIYKSSPIFACILEEPEYTLLNLLENLKSERKINSIKGIAFYGKKRIVNPPLRIQDLDNLPFPKHDFFINKGYYFYYPVNINSKVNIGYILSSRGCPFSCFFCSPIERSSYSKRYISRTPKNIVDEMSLLEKKGINAIYFIDDVFTLDKKRVLNICDELLRRKLKIKWIIQSRVDLLDQEMLVKMKKAGCSTICLGIESFSEDILKGLNKRITTEQILRIVDMVNKAGIMTVGYFIIGNPNETREDVLNTIESAKKMPLDMIQVHFFTRYPGSQAFIETKKQNTFYKFYSNTNSRQIRYNELIYLQKYFYRSFYLRIDFLIKFLFKFSFFSNLKVKIRLIIVALKYILKK